MKGADLDLRFWFGLFGPRGMPETVKAKVERASAIVMSDPHVRERLANLDIASDFAPGPVSRTRLESEIRKDEVH